MTLLTGRWICWWQEAGYSEFSPSSSPVVKRGKEPEQGVDRKRSRHGRRRFEGAGPVRDVLCGRQREEKGEKERDEMIWRFSAWENGVRVFRSWRWPNRSGMIVLLVSRNWHSSGGDDRGNARVRRSKCCRLTRFASWANYNCNQCPSRGTV